MSAECWQKPEKCPFLEQNLLFEHTYFFCSKKLSKKCKVPDFSLGHSLVVCPTNVNSPNTCVLTWYFFEISQHFDLLFTCL